MATLLYFRLSLRPKQSRPRKVSKIRFRAGHQHSCKRLLHRLEIRGWKLRIFLRSLRVWQQGHHQLREWQALGCLREAREADSSNNQLKNSKLAQDQYPRLHYSLKEDELSKHLNLWTNCLTSHFKARAQLQRIDKVASHLLAPKRPWDYHTEGLRILMIVRAWSQ